MPVYAVFWAIDVEANSPREAAIRAREAQEPGSTALFFVVYDEDGSPPEMGGEDGGISVDLLDDENDDNPNEEG